MTKPAMAPTGKPVSHRLVALAVFALVLLLQLPLALSPGYFSHDELQWAAIAAQGGAFDWHAVQTFQYRPLTFTLWIWLSRALFDQPQAFHALIVAWGALNAALLAVLGRRFGMPIGAAVLGALAFALGPYATYVHGWVGTLGDLLWVTCALAIAIVVARNPTRSVVVAVSLFFTVAALLAKEAAVSIPALLALGWWFSGRQHRWGFAAMASAIPVAIYLTLRIGVLLFSSERGGAYDWSVLHIPARWLEYQLFAPIPMLFETSLTFARGVTLQIAVSLSLWLALLAALWRSDKRLPRLFLAGGVIALGPVLILAQSWNHYAYAFAALTSMVVAAAWHRAPRWGRMVIVLFAALHLWHGINVMRTMRHVGEVQAVFSPALADAVHQSKQPVVHMVPAAGSETWIFQRLSNQIPSHQGVAIGGRVQLVGSDAAADYRIEADGRLTRLR